MKSSQSLLAACIAFIVAGYSVLPHSVKRWPRLHYFSAQLAHQACMAAMKIWTEILRSLPDILTYTDHKKSSVVGVSRHPCPTDPPSPLTIGKGVSDQVCCTSVTPVAFYERKEPAIILKNNSSYQVSFWVIEEDKTKPTKVALDKISKQMGAPLDTDISPGSSTDSANLNNNEAIKGSEDCYVLTADHRVDSWGTNVPFLKGSNSMRVLGFFRKDSSETWTRYKNNVYSIRRGKKIFTLVATDKNIKRHQAGREG